jgi:hypothetical protein
MISSVQTGLRLADSLEDFVSQEAVLLRAADYGGVIAVQERMAPLVARLAELADQTNSALRARIRAIIARRAESLAGFEIDVARVRDELTAIKASERQVARVGPAYVTKAAPRSRIQVAL